jgi:hypothetical protein
MHQKGHAMSANLFEGDAGRVGHANTGRAECRDAGAQAAGRPARECACERQRELKRLERLARLLDSQLRVPGTQVRIGLDGLIGLIPGIGDALAALPSAYMIVRGHQLGARARTLGRMAANTGIDYAVGSIPLVGDLFDIGFKGNLRNIDLLRAEFGDLPQRR